MGLRFLSSIVLIPVVIYLLSFALIAYNYDAYGRIISRNSGNTAIAKAITPKLIDYFRGKGEMPSEFGIKEASHLKDVKFVFHFLLYFMIMCFLFLVFNSGKKSVLYGSVIALIIPLILYLIPFDFLFNSFHHIFFETGTWVFDESSVLIQMYPFEFFLGFFRDIVFRGWIISFVIFLLSMTAFSKRK